jgi:hypothetical protein
MCNVNYQRCRCKAIRIVRYCHACILFVVWPITGRPFPLTDYHLTTAYNRADTAESTGRTATQTAVSDPSFYPLQAAVNMSQLATDACYFLVYELLISVNHNRTVY